MKKDKFIIFLTVTEILSVVTLTILFVLRCTLVISCESNTSLLWYIFESDAFLEYSVLDSMLNFSLLFAIGFLVVLLILKFKKTDKCRKICIIITIVLLVLSLVISAVHLVVYEYASRNEIWDFYSTDDEDFQPIPTQYSMYFPHFDMMDEITDKSISYEYNDTTTALGRYLFMNTWCYDLEVSFYYEEIKTKSGWLMNQFIYTKGVPNYLNDDYGTVFVESTQNEEYDCSIYKHNDFYEIWFVEKDRCVILRYEGFNKLFNYTEDDILNNAKEIYIKTR